MSERYVVVDADTYEELAEKERRVMLDLPAGHAIELVPEPPVRRVYRVTS